jgi:hypothetical protein
MRILVVDDQFQSRWSIAGWLSTFFHGIAIESAASAEAACAAAGADYRLEKRPLQVRLLAFLQPHFRVSIARRAII